MTDSDNPTLSFTDVEATICHISRLIEEDKLYFVQMAGAPLMALLMGKRLHAPNVGYVVEEGAVCPDPEFPLPRMMLGSSGAGKSTIAAILAPRLVARGRTVTLLDGFQQVLDR